AFSFTHSPTPAIYTPSLHDALPISRSLPQRFLAMRWRPCGPTFVETAHTGPSSPDWRGRAASAAGWRCAVDLRPPSSFVPQGRASFSGGREAGQAVSVAGL